MKWLVNQQNHKGETLLRTRMLEHERRNMERNFIFSEPKLEKYKFRQNDFLFDFKNTTESNVHLHD